MIALAIETSDVRGSAAARKGERIVEALLSAERRHASDLAPAIERLLAELGAEPGSIDALAVGLGPGSFTGLRVGVATALGVARGSGARLRGVPSFEALALDALPPGEEGAVAMDARAGAFYHARYRRSEREVEVVLPPEAVGAERLRELLAIGGPILAPPGLAEDAGLDERTAARISSPGPAAAAAVLALGLARLAELGPHAPEELEPLYLRPFAARRRG